MSILSVKLVATSTVERVVLNALGEKCGFAVSYPMPSAISLAIVFREADPPHAAFFAGCFGFLRDLATAVFFAPV